MDDMDGDVHAVHLVHPVHSVHEVHSWAKKGLTAPTDAPMLAFMLQM